MQFDRGQTTFQTTDSTRGERTLRIFRHAYKAKTDRARLALPCPETARRLAHDMPRTRQHNITAAQWSPNGGSLGTVDLTQPAELPVRRGRLLRDRAAAAPAQGGLPAPPAGARAGRGARRVTGRRRRARHEGVGAREGRDSLHPRLPAAHRPDGREARLVLQPHDGRRGARGVLGQGADPGRAGRLLVPHRRRARDLRGARLHRLGPDEPGVPAPQPERRAALHPDGVRVLDGRGARREDPAAALDGRAVALGDPRAAAARRRRRPAASSPPSAPSRSTS